MYEDSIKSSTKSAISKAELEEKLEKTLKEEFSLLTEDDLFEMFVRDKERTVNIKDVDFSKSEVQTGRLYGNVENTQTQPKTLKAVGKKQKGEIYTFTNFDSLYEFLEDITELRLQTLGSEPLLGLSDALLMRLHKLKSDSAYLRDLSQLWRIMLRDLKDMKFRMEEDIQVDTGTDLLDLNLKRLEEIIERYDTNIFIK